MPCWWIRQMRGLNEWSINMKSIYLVPLASTLLLCSLHTSAQDTEDEYEYMQTPVANQISDLTDDDRDGVVNARDICPETPLGSLVDNDGCGASKKAAEERKLRVLFDNDSYAIKPMFAEQIKTMSDFLKKYESASIQIQGYASRVGSPEYNLALSKKRAHAVQDKLLSYGITPRRVTIVGYGETRVEAKGDDEISHALNRRVTATVVGLKQQVVEEWTIFTSKEK